MSIMAVSLSAHRLQVWRLTSDLYLLSAWTSPKSTPLNTPPPPALHLQNPNQLFIALCFERSHILASKALLDACRQLVQAVRAPRESIGLHVLCPALDGRTEVLEQMPETVAAAAAAHGVGQEGSDARPAGAERGGYAGVWRKGMLVDGRGHQDDVVWA
jgi:hypothetical protein